MGTSGTRHGEFRTALRTGSYSLALEIARDLPHISLADALRLTLLAARKSPQQFDGMARRWLARLLVERQPSLDEMAWASALLSNAPGGDADDDRLTEILAALI